MSRLSYLPPPPLPWPQRVELIGLCAFALGYPLSKALANIGLGLLLIAFIAQFRARRAQLAHDPFMRLALVWFVWLLGLTNWAALTQPETASHQFHAMFEVFGFGFIPLVAWATRGETQRLDAVFALLLTGLLIHLLTEAHWQGWLPYLDYGPDVRDILGVNRNIGGVLIATALLGSLLLPLAWRPVLGVFPLILNAALLILLGWIWIVINSRATWAALLLGLLASIATLLYGNARERTHGPRYWHILLVCAIFASILWLGRDMLANRLAEEPKAWQALFSGRFSELPQTSLGIRASLAALALELWQAHPLTGWGPQINHLFGSFGHHPEAAEFAQLHDGYLELLARTGLIGLAAAGTALWLLLRSLLTRTTLGRAGRARTAFLFGALIVFLVENGSISLMYFQHGWHYMVLFGGLIAGFRVPHASRDEQALQRKLWFITKPGSRATYFSALAERLDHPAAAYRLRAPLSGLFQAWFAEPLPAASQTALDDAVRLKLGEKTNGHGLARRLFFAGHGIFLHMLARVYLQYYTAALRHGQPATVAVWNGEKFNQALVAAAAKHLGIQVLRFENGVLPRTTTVDAHGINANNSVPRDPEFFRHWARSRPPWANVELAPRRPVDGKSLQSTIQVLPERFLLVPFQVDNDTQILRKSPWIRHMRHLYHSLCEVLPQLADQDLHLVFKEHPSTTRTYPDLHRHARTHPRVHFVNDKPLGELLEEAYAVLTINSTVGLEALLKSCKVITLGDAFYNVPGLVLHAGDASALPDVLARLPGFMPDEEIRSGFFHYLSEAYAVSGSWRNPTEDDLRTMAQRVNTLMTEGARCNAS